MAAHESLEILVDFGKAFLSRRRMHAAGGSNSTTSALDLGGLGDSAGGLLDSEASI